MDTRRQLKSLASACVAVPLLVLLGFCAALGFVVGKDSLLHNLALARHARDFRQLPHPPDTAWVAYQQRLGLLSGNGNHCDYFTGELRTFHGDQQSVAEFYRQAATGELWLHLLFVEDGRLPDRPFSPLPHDLRRLEDWLPGEHPAEPLYLVVGLHVTLSDPGWDLRCH